MKKLLTYVVEFKTWACLSFTASVFIYALVSLIYGEHTVEIAMLFELLAICLVGTFLQYICFTSCLIKRWPYGLRMLMFSVLMLGMLSGAAVLFQWFAVGEALSWIIFAASFLVILFGMTIGFEVYFRITGKRYDGLLGEYKQKREKSGGETPAP